MISCFPGLKRHCVGSLANGTKVKVIVSGMVSASETIQVKARALAIAIIEVIFKFLGGSKIDVGIVV